MKVFQPFKAILLTTLALLFATGALVFVYSQWLRVDRGLGPEPRPEQITILQVHSIAGLLFLALFGYLWATHVLPGWRRRRRVKTGVVLTLTCVLLFLTVPLLFYASNEEVKGWAAWIHTYLGLISLLPFVAHLQARPD